MDEKPRGKLLLVILCVVFLDLVGIGILIPVVPILLAPPAFRDRFSFSRRFLRSIPHSSASTSSTSSISLQETSEIFWRTWVVDRNCPSL